MKKLVMPIFYGSKIYTDVEIKRPTPSILADSFKIVESGNLYSAMLVFVSGCITELKDIEENIISDKLKIRDICSDLKERALEVLSVQIILYYDPEDGIEGYYQCPRCGEKKICEKNGDIDTRDFVSQLEITYLEDIVDEFEVIFDEPIPIKTGKDVIDSIEKISMRHPTISDRIQAYSRYGSDSVRVQLYVYVQCLITANGNPVDNSWKNKFGMYMFENMPNMKIDMKKISSEIVKYGYNAQVKKVCNKCGKEWNVNVNTSNFFGSALQSTGE